MERIIHNYLVYSRPKERNMEQFQSLVQEFYTQYSIQQLLFTLNYSFKNPQYLLQAFIHSSFWNEWSSAVLDTDSFGTNERLEFLGDSVWSLFVGTKLYEVFPDANEGKLTQFRMVLSNGNTQGLISEHLGLLKNILIGKGMLNNAHKAFPKLHENVFESLWGAIYLDAGFERAYKLFERFVLVLKDAPDSNMDLFNLEFLEKMSKTPKTLLQEFCLKHFRISPHYKILQAQDITNQIPWEIGVYLDEDLIIANSGSSKKELENTLANQAISILSSSISSSKGITLC